MSSELGSGSELKCIWLGKSNPAKGRIHFCCSRIGQLREAQLSREWAWFQPLCGHAPQRLRTDTITYFFYILITYYTW